MIINTGQRTDIPAFYAEWLSVRLREGFVCVRNPFQPKQVTRYILHPDLVDLIGFCTKDPSPMFPHMDMLRDYGQFWHVTITPYGRDIEPHTPPKRTVLAAFRTLSGIIGPDRIAWRYDPVLIHGRYSIDLHLRAFRAMADELAGFTRIAVVSFIDLYPKVLRNFPGLREVPQAEQRHLVRSFSDIAAERGMTLKTCAEGKAPERFGADCSGCMTIPMYEKALGRKLIVPAYAPARRQCSCYLGCDIGAYSSCLHLCRYCYANSNAAAAMLNHRRHDPASPFLIGGAMPGDTVHDAAQKSWIDPRLPIMI